MKENIRRTRLTPEVRRKMILDASVAHFAEYGFDADLRSLAKVIGVSHGLVLKYFGSKEELLNSVYSSVYEARWNDRWLESFGRGDADLGSRIKNFYSEYLSIADDPIWIKISLWSSLHGKALSTRYIAEHVSPLIEAIAAEIAEDSTGNQKGDLRIEKELVWSMHSAVIYYLIRKYVHKTELYIEVSDHIDLVVENFMSILKARSRK